MAEPTIKCDKCGERFLLAAKERVLSQHDFNYAVPDSWLILNGLGMTQETLRKAYESGRAITAHHLCHGCTLKLKQWIESSDPGTADTL